MDGLLFEISCAHYLVLLAESLEELFDKWKDVIQWNGMKVNIANTKMIVRGEGDIV